MDKITKILLLVNLLYHRRYVTLAEIMETCHISERTVYRYINDISSAHIPVYYDKDIGAYRLLSDGGFDIGRMGIDDAIIISTALYLLSRRANDLYRREIEFLIKRIFTSQSLPLEELWDTFRHRMQAAGDDFSEAITSLIIHAAVVNSKRLHISMSRDEDQEARLEIENPALYFKDEWRLAGRRLRGDKAIPLSDIKMASTS